MTDAVNIEYLSITCPLCRSQNQCATPTPDGCWCNFLDLSQAKPTIERLLESLPESDRSGCICRACLETHGGIPT